MCVTFTITGRGLNSCFLLLYLSLTLLLEFNKAGQAPFTSHTRAYVCACAAEMSKEKDQYGNIVARRRLMIGFLHAYIYVCMYILCLQIVKRNLIPFSVLLFRSHVAYT